jgi:hypothetical protein
MASECFNAFTPQPFSTIVVIESTLLLRNLSVQ